MPPRTYLLPPATGTMHSLFLSSTLPGLHGSIFAFHSHTLYLSSGRRRLPLALLRLRTPPSSSFGCISALLADFDLRHTILFRSFFRHILLNNTPSLAANAEDDCPTAVGEDDNTSASSGSACSIEADIEFLSCDDDDDDTNATNKTTANIIKVDLVLRHSRAVAQTTNAAAAPLGAYNAASAQRTLQSAAPQAVDSTALDATPCDDNNNGVELHGTPHREESERVAGGSGRSVIAIAAINQKGPESSPTTLTLPAANPLAPTTPDQTSVSSAPAALSAAPGTDEAKLAAYAASVRQTGVSEMNE